MGCECMLVWLASKQKAAYNYTPVIHANLEASLAAVVLSRCTFRD